MRDEVVREGGALAHTFTEPAAEPAGPTRAGADATTSAALPEPTEVATGPDQIPPGTSLPAAARDEPKFTPDGRPIRKVPFPVGDPPQPGPRTPPLRGPLPRRGRVRRGPIPWLIVAVIIVAVIIVAVFAWRTLRPRSDGATPAAPAGQSRAVPQGGTPEPPARN